MDCHSGEGASGFPKRGQGIAVDVFLLAGWGCEAACHQNCRGIPDKTAEYLHRSRPKYDF